MDIIINNCTIYNSISRTLSYAVFSPRPPDDINSVDGDDLLVLFIGIMIIGLLFAWWTIPLRIILTLFGIKIKFKNTLK